MAVILFLCLINKIISNELYNYLIKIKLFEEAQNNNATYSSSLQKAKKSMIEENKFDLFAHPTFWAPFVMIGIN